MKSNFKDYDYVMRNHTLHFTSHKEDLGLFSFLGNVNFDDAGWQRSTRPVAQGGFGLSSAVNLSLPAYASSLSATRQLVGQILQDVFGSCPTSEIDSVAEGWTELGHELITMDKKPFQWYWSSAVHKALFHSLKAGAPPSHLARILTAAQGH